MKSTHPLLRGDAINPGDRETMEREGNEVPEERKARVEQAGSKVLQHAPCSVLVARRRADGSA